MHSVVVVPGSGKIHFRYEKVVGGQLVMGFKFFFIAPRQSKRVAIRALNSVGGKSVNALAPILKSRLRLISIVVRRVL